jgi:hypothetical protein
VMRATNKSKPSRLKSQCTRASFQF